MGLLRAVELTLAPTRYPPSADARPISASRVGPSCQDFRHVGRPHSTGTLTCASSDTTVDDAFAPSDRFTVTPQTVGNEIRLGCIATPGLIRCREMLLRGLFDSLRTKGGRLVSGKTRCCATTRTDVVDVAVGCLKDGCGSAISRAGVSD